MKSKLAEKLFEMVMFLCFTGIVFLLLIVPIVIVSKSVAARGGGIFLSDGEIYSVMPSVYNTALLVLLTLLFAFPIALFAAMFLWYYQRRWPRLTGPLQALIDSLGAVPSIVYALFGMLVFVEMGAMGFSLLAGTLTMAIMVLPILIRCCEQALQGVPTEVYLSGLSLGQSKMYVMLFALLPQCWRGVCSGMLLSAGRVVGESAALIFTLGTAGGVISSLLSSGRTLAVQVYTLAGEGLFLSEAYATSAVLLCFAVVLFLVSKFIAAGDVR